MFLPGESQGWGYLVGCHLWGLTESDITEADLAAAAAAEEPGRLQSIGSQELGMT